MFPLGSFREAAIHLRRPFTPQAIKFKVQSQFGEQKGCLVVAYIDARLVVERLNLLVPDLWFDDYRPLDGNFVRCDLTVDGVTRPDVGEGAGKAGYSDALKRAAVKFGIGVSLYAIPQAHLWASQHGDYIELRKSGQKQAFAITPAGDQALRRRYAKWLEEHGAGHFGVPLDHGDVEGAVGDPDVPAEPQPDKQEETRIRQLLEGHDADRWRDQARATYAEIASLVGKAAYPPGEFKAGLDAHGHSLDALAGFVSQLEARLERARESAQVKV